MRRETQLYLPALSQRRGFSSGRVEHLLNRLVRALPANEVYLEVGALEGRTIEAAAFCNADKRLYTCDPGEKYGSSLDDIPGHVGVIQAAWQTGLSLVPGRIGCCFYDADHSASATREFLLGVTEMCAPETVCVIDDWDRRSVRDGAFAAAECDPRWRLLREMPEYTDGMTASPHHFGYFFGVSVWGWRA